MAQKVRSCGIITLGAVIYALAFDWFVAPNQIAMGGVTGLAQIVNALVPVLPVGVLSILVNVPLFLAGWRLLGGRLLVSSLYAMAVSSLAIDVIAWMHIFPPMDPILATLYGGAGMGVGLGLVFSQGATTGGTDIIGKLLKLKLPWLPIGKLVMIPDMVVVILAAVVFGTVNAALYGLIQMYLLSKVMDMILYGWDTSRVAYIITDRWEETAGYEPGRDAASGKRRIHRRGEAGAAGGLQAAGDRAHQADAAGDRPEGFFHRVRRP